MKIKSFGLQPLILMIILIVIFPLTKAKAFVMDTNMMYFSDTATLADTTTTSRTQYDLGIGFAIRKNYLFMLSYGSFNSSDATSTTTTFACTNMGIRFGMYFGQGRGWYTSLDYGIKATVTYSGTSSEEYRGTSLKYDLGRLFWLGDSMALGLKLVYYAPSFNEKVVSSTLTTVSYTRATIYPGLSLLFDF